MSVTQACRVFHATLEREHPQLAVFGEVSRWKRLDSGHAYFSLKDRDARLDCVMWSKNLSRLKFEPDEGMTVVCRGRPSVFGRTGRLQLVVTHLEPQGLGALHAEFQQRVEAFRAEGLLAADRKRALPLLPRRIGVVTSRDGAALHDVLRTLWKHDPAVQVVLAPAPVQGRGAAPRIAEALRRLDRLGRCDVLLVVRGGGSLEDLWAFNEEPVVRAISTCRVPVVAGIGHESDVTIAELVADVRSATPTAAAAAAVGDRVGLRAAFVQAERRLERALGARIERHRHRLAQLERCLPSFDTAVLLRRQHVDDLLDRLEASVREGLRRRERGLVRCERRLQGAAPRARLTAARGKLERALDRLAARTDTRFVSARHRIASAAGRLEAHSPLKVLSRGYAVVEHRDGQILRDPTDVKEGDRLKVTLQRGRLMAQVTSTTQESDDD